MTVVATLGRLTAAYLTVALLALLGGVVTGLAQGLEHAGINVYPEDVNALLRTVPGIIDAATIGVADERWGEVVVSGLVAKPGVRPSEQEVASHFLAQASPEKLPREFHFFDDLPRGPAGWLAARLRRRVAGVRRRRC